MLASRISYDLELDLQPNLNPQANVRFEKKQNVCP